MLYINKKMLNELSKKNLKENKKNADKIIKDIVENTILKNECLLYDKHKEIRNASISDQWIKEKFFDFTGYEASINELRYDKSIFSDINIFYFIAELNNKLENKFFRKIVLYFSLIDLDIDLRFHSFRASETDWMSNDLDCYDHPIICMK